MNFVNYTHHLFFASGGRTGKHGSSVKYLFLSPAAEERKKKAHKSHRRKMPCLSASLFASSAHPFKGHTPRCSFFCSWWKSILGMITNITVLGLTLCFRIRRGEELMKIQTFWVVTSSRLVNSTDVSEERSASRMLVTTYLLVDRA
jgi:hypothetical protein